jgi:hypothetical protein
MSIKDWSEKIKGQGRELVNGVHGEGSAGKYYTALIIILVGLSSFGLGRLSAFDESRQPITIEEEGIASANAETKTQTASIAKSTGETVPPAAAAGGKTLQPRSGQIVASRNGTKYYFPWCASNIAEKNKIWFNSESDARAKGYQPATNCKGLK